MAPPKKIINYALALSHIMLLAKAFRETRRYLAIHSFRFYAVYYLGFSLFDYQIRYAIKLLKSHRHLILAPREHGKTKLIIEGLITWLVCRDRNVRIIIVCESKSRAVERLGIVKIHFETNKRLLEDFGAFYHRKNKWEQDKIYVIRPRHDIHPTVEAVGVNCAVTGGRADYIIADDPVSYESARSDTETRKISEYFRATLTPILSKTGTMWVIGTRKRFNDLYSEMISNPIWTVTTDKALIKEPEDWDFQQLQTPIIHADGTEQHFLISIRGEDQGACLNPQKWPVISLLERRLEIGSILFKQEYQNEVIDDETALFKRPWLEQCRQDTLSYVHGDIPETSRSRYIAIFQGNDPSLIISKQRAEARDTAYQVIWTVGLCPNGDRELIGLYRRRGVDPDQVLVNTEEEYRRFNPMFHCIEVNSFGMIYAHFYLKNTDMKLVKHYTTGNKNDPFQGVPGLAVLFENSKYKLPYQSEEDKRITDLLINEFNAFGTGVQDDIIMAAWICETGIERYLKGQRRLSKMDQRD